MFLTGAAHQSFNPVPALPKTPIPALGDLPPPPPSIAYVFSQHVNVNIVTWKPIKKNDKIRGTYFEYYVLQKDITKVFKMDFFLVFYYHHYVSKIQHYSLNCSGGKSPWKYNYNDEKISKQCWKIMENNDDNKWQKKTDKMIIKTSLFPWALPGLP